MRFGYRDDVGAQLRGFSRMVDRVAPSPIDKLAILGLPTLSTGGLAYLLGIFTKQEISAYLLDACELITIWCLQVMLLSAIASVFARRSDDDFPDV